MILEFFFFYFSKKLGRSGDGKRSIKLGWPRSKTAKNGSVSAQRSTWQGAKHLKIAKVCFNPLIFEKSFLEIYIKFTCWWLFCCRSAKHFHIVLCVWICNSELRHGRILVTPCSFYVLLQCNGIARCFFGIKMPVGWQNFIENPNGPDCFGWSKEQCGFATAALKHGIRNAESGNGITET